MTIDQDSTMCSRSSVYLRVVFKPLL